jgi:hypothetical protein
METGTKQLWVCGSACLTSATRAHRSYRCKRLIMTLNLRIPSYSNLFQGGGSVQIKLPNEPIRIFIFPTAHQLLMPNTSRLETKKRTHFLGGFRTSDFERSTTSGFTRVVPSRARSCPVEAKRNLFSRRQRRTCSLMENIGL